MAWPAIGWVFLQRRFLKGVMIVTDWNKYRQCLGMNCTCAIRNVVNGTYIHRTISEVRLFPSRRDALNFIDKKGLNSKIYRVVAVEY